jgi:hypothetical protein
MTARAFVRVEAIISLNEASLAGWTGFNTTCLYRLCGLTPGKVPRAKSNCVHAGK